MNEALDHLGRNDVRHQFMPDLRDLDDLDEPAAPSSRRQTAEQQDGPSGMSGGATPIIPSGAL